MKLGKKILQELKEKKRSIENLYVRYFINSQYEAEAENVLKLLNENICSFKELVDKFKNFRQLNYLLKNKKFFEELIQSNKLNTEDLRYLFNKIDNKHELDKLCENTSLIKYVLNEFMLNKETVDRLTRMIKKIDWCKKENNIHTLFDRIEYRNKNNKEILKLNELNKKIYTLNDFNLNLDQKLALAEILKDNEQAQNTLIQIIENHLEDQYDFDTLKKNID